jgi:predicted ATPase
MRTSRSIWFRDQHPADANKFQPRLGQDPLASVRPRSATVPFVPLSMKRYILTGTPGCGKTSIIRSLEVAGYAVVEEAATDVIALRQAQGIAEPWTHPSFIDDITNLQKLRQIRIADTAGVQFHDRSPVCTYALSVWLGFPISITLADEMERIASAQIYQKQVFFIENLGFCEPSAARKISFEDSLKFEKVHEETYRSFGYECIKVAPLELVARVEKINRHVLATA